MGEMNVDRLYGESAKFAMIEGAKAVHIIDDGVSLCGCDFIEGHTKFKSKRWRRSDEIDEFPDDVILCRRCDMAYSEGTTMDAVELANHLRELAGVERRDTSSLNKSEKLALVRALQGD